MFQVFCQVMQLANYCIDSLVKTSLENPKLTFHVFHLVFVILCFKIITDLFLHLSVFGHALMHKLVKVPQTCNLVVLVLTQTLRAAFFITSQAHEICQHAMNSTCLAPFKGKYIASTLPEFRTSFFIFPKTSTAKCDSDFSFRTNTRFLHFHIYS